MPVRRSFLKLLAASAGAGLIELSPVPAIARKLWVPLPDGEWIYDAPTGTCRNVELTDAILAYKKITLKAPRDHAATIPRLTARGWREYGWHARVPNVSPGVLLPLSQTREFCMRLAAPLDKLPVEWAFVELRAGIPRNYGRVRYVAWYGWGKPV